MSEIRANTISDAAGTGPIALTKQSAAKAWVNANGSAVLAESFNISGGVDNGTADCTYNLTSSMSSATSAILATSIVASALPYSTVPFSATASSVRVLSWRAYDSTAIEHSHSIAVMGDLA